MAQTHVGIDVSKRQLDVAIRGRPEEDDCWLTTRRALRLSVSA